MSSARKEEVIQSASPEAKTGWCGSSAWACALALIMLSFSMNTLLRFASSRGSLAAREWLASPFGIVALDIFRAACGLLVVFVLAGPSSARAFASRAGLDCPPSFAGWLAAWLGAGIGLLELYFVTKGWEPQNTSAASFRASGGGVWLAYVVSTVLIAPFYEETIMRGFLYRAFRGSYTVPVSTAFVVLVVGYFHWGLLSMPLFFADLVIATILLCLVRELTSSTWNCILFHAAHNAAVSLRWPFYVGGILLALALCLQWNSRSGGSRK